MDDRQLTTLLERTYPRGPLPPLERLEQRAAAIRRHRRARRAAGAVAVTAAIVVVAVVVWVPGLDRRDVQTPLRPVPNTLPTQVPDVSKTHVVLVTPSTGLRDGQIVRVSGRFAPPIAAEDSIDVRMCRAGVTPPTVNDDCDGTTGQGARRIPLATLPLRRYPYLVRRTITVGGQPVDCAAEPGCVLYADSGDRLKGPIHSRYQGKYGIAPLVFDPVAPPLPGPIVTVRPPDGLRDGDTVTVRAQHFRPFGSVGATVCVKGTDVCDAVNVPVQRIGPNGSLSLIHPVWSVFSSADGALQDCRAVACVVRFGTYDRSTLFDVPVSFAPGSPASYPSLTLEPAGPYTDGQQVTVTLHGWPGSIGRRPDLAIPNLVIGQCARSGSGYLSAAVCPGETSLHPEPDGRYTATLALHRTISENVSEPIDCTQLGNCRVALALTSTGGEIPPGVFFGVILGVDVVVN